MGTGSSIVKVFAGQAPFNVPLFDDDTMGILVERLAAIKEYGRYPDTITFNGNIIYMRNPGYWDKENNKLYGRTDKLHDIGIKDGSVIRIPGLVNAPVTFPDERVIYFILNGGTYPFSQLCSALEEMIHTRLLNLTISGEKYNKYEDKDRDVNITSDTTITVNSFERMMD